MYTVLIAAIFDVDDIFHSPLPKLDFWSIHLDSFQLMACCVEAVCTATGLEVSAFMMALTVLWFMVLLFHRCMQHLHSHTESGRLHPISLQVISVS